MDEQRTDEWMINECRVEGWRMDGRLINEWIYDELMKTEGTNRSLMNV